MMLRRLPDWSERLEDHIAAVCEQPFRWGRSDCLTWCGGAVEAMTGLRLWSEYAGRYRSRAGMVRMLAAAGHADILEAASNIMERAGIPVCAPEDTEPGDPAVIDSGEGGQSLAVRLLDGYAVRHRGGLAVVDLIPIRTWRLE